MVLKCEKCEREFNSSDALEQHMNVKHGKKKMYTYALFAVVALLVIAIGYFIVKSPPPADTVTPGLEVTDTYVLEADSMDAGAAMHIHPSLQIVINGQNIPIPEGVGVTSSKMNILHTHDGTGKIHIESPAVKDFKLRHFFLVWGKWSGKEKVFNSTCILDYCNTADKKVKMFVNNVENSEFENLILKDLDRIKIVYE